MLRLHTPPKRSKSEHESPQFLFEITEFLSSDTRKPFRTSPLPEELLVIIFWMVIGSYHDRYWIEGHREDSWREQREAAATMRSASQVDRSWRSAALGCKRIWGMLLDIDFNSNEWVAELVSRSNPAPLVVQSVYRPGDSHVRFLSPKWSTVLAESQTPRLSVLHVAFNGDDYREPLLDALMRPMPLLEYLHIEEDTHPVKLEHQTYSELSSDLLLRSAPNLRALSLERAIISKSVDLSSFRLIHLDITFGDDDDTPVSVCISPTYLLDMLAGQPLLETFNYNSHVIPFDLYGFLPPREVYLPRLSVLSMDGYNPDVGDVFGNLVIPTTCDVNLTLHSVTSVSPMESLLRGIDRFFRCWNPNPEQRSHWTIDAKSPSEFFISLAILDAESEETSSAIFSVSFEGDEDVIPQSNHLVSILKCVRDTHWGERNAELLLGLADFHLDIYRHLHPGLLSFFSSFQAVRKLLLNQTSMKSTVKCLLKEESNEMDPIFFPHLQELFLRVGHEDFSLEINAFWDYVNRRLKMDRSVPDIQPECIHGDCEPAFVFLTLPQERADSR